MRDKAGAIALVAGALLIGTGQSLADGAEARVEASRAAVKAFAQSLQQALQTAMASEGAVAAIEVCNHEAPAIAAHQSEANGWQVGRTSLKPRNPGNAPDAWQQTVLERFETEKAAGKPVETLEAWEVVETGGERTFRYMKAIPTGPVCLTCHGGNLSPELAAKLDTLYPDDKARGYALGDIRGAFTVSQPINQGTAGRP